MIQLNKPYMRTDVILAGLKEILNVGWIGLGPKVKEFEKAIGEYIGVDPRRVVCLNSGTSALQFACWWCKKKRVATTPITFVSTNHAILYNGGTPVFYDVQPRTGNVDIASLQKTEFDAIIVVHIGGQPCDMEAVEKEAGERLIIEDCAHAFGSKYPNGKRVGNSKNICCFSFHAVKNLPCGDGGCLIARSPEEGDFFRKARWMGIDLDTATRAQGAYKWEYNVEFVGWKAHMNDITAVIGLAQLPIVDEVNNNRRAIAVHYMKHLKNTIMPDYDLSLTSAHFVPFFFENRDDVYNALIKEGVGPGMHYKANYHYKMYKKCMPKYGLPGAKWYEEHELTLPLHRDLTLGDMEKIISTINGVAKCTG